MYKIFLLEILTEHVKEQITKLSRSNDVRVRNLATIFLEDYFFPKVEKNESGNVDEDNKQDRKRKENQINL